MTSAARPYGFSLLLAGLVLLAGFASLAWSAWLRHESYRQSEEDVRRPLDWQELELGTYDYDRPSRLWGYSLWTRTLGIVLLALAAAIWYFGSPAGSGAWRQSAGWGLTGLSVAAGVAATLLVSSMGRRGFVGDPRVRLLDPWISGPALAIVASLAALGVWAGFSVLALPQPFLRVLAFAEAAALLAWLPTLR